MEKIKRKVIAVLTLILIFASGIVFSFASEKGKYDDVIKGLKDKIILDSLLIESDVKTVPYILDINFDTDDINTINELSDYVSKDVVDLKAICLTPKDEKVADSVAELLDYDELENVVIGINEQEDITDNVKETIYKGKEYIKRNTTTLYKEVLRDNKDVIIISTGYPDNIALLLKDSEGYELIKNNCKTIYVECDSYPSGWNSNFGYTKETIEAIKYINDNCPVDIIYFVNNSDVYNSTAIIEKSLYDIKNTAIPVEFTIDGDGVNTFEKNEQEGNRFVVLN